jgi:beta-mannosidase
VGGLFRSAVFVQLRLTRQFIRTENQFVTYRVDVKDRLVKGTNELVITFPSTFLKGKDLEKKDSQYECWNGDPSRLHVRKAQYNYGWDWGPTLLTVGPWRPIYLHSYHTRISDLHTSAPVNESLDADLVVRIALSPSETWTTAEVSLKEPAGSGSGIITSQSNINLDNGAARIVFHFKYGEVKLWHPVGYGEQPLYEVQVRIYDDVRSLLLVKNLLLLRSSV